MTPRFHDIFCALVGGQDCPRRSTRTTRTAPQKPLCLAASCVCGQLHCEAGDSHPISSSSQRTRHRNPGAAIACNGWRHGVCEPLCGSLTLPVCIVRVLCCLGFRSGSYGVTRAAPERATSHGKEKKDAQSTACALPLFSVDWPVRFFSIFA